MEAVLRTCADCDFMRAKIPVSDGKRYKQHIDYRRGIARCVKGLFVRDRDGQEQTFSMRLKGFIPKAWQRAETCEHYSDTGLSIEMANLLVRVWQLEKLIELD